MNDTPITREEMIEMFGSECPVEAINLIWKAPDEMTLSDIRKRLREIAAERQEKDALLKRLRSEAVNWSASCGGLFDEAADRIEALEAALRHVETQLGLGHLNAALHILRAALTPESHHE